FPSQPQPENLGVAEAWPEEEIIGVQAVIEEQARARIDANGGSPEKAFVLGILGSLKAILDAEPAVESAAAESEASFREGVAQLRGEILHASFAGRSDVVEVCRSEWTEAIGVALVEFQIQLQQAEAGGTDAVIFERGFEGALIARFVETANPDCAAHAETR